MPDFGDEIGAEAKQTATTLLQRFLWQTKNGNYQRSIGEGGQMHCGFRYDSIQERNDMAELLKDKGITFKTQDDPPTIIFAQRDLGKAQSIIEEEKNRIKSHDGKDVDAHSAVVESVTTPINSNEYIKSHDGMDIDKHTAVRESVTPVQGTGDFSWKVDIQSRVEQAYEGAATEREFIDRCEECGLKVDRATDGELMFVHPDAGHWKVRADTLDERYTRQALKEKEKPVRLEEEARDMRNASKQLSAEKEVFSRDREVPNLQSLSK